MITFDLKGMDGVEQAIRELVEATSTRTAKAALQRGLVKAAEPMVARARQHAPKASGRLGRSITASPRLAADAGKLAFAAALRGGADRATAVSALRAARRANRGASPTVTIYVGPSGRAARKAHLVEFGTKPHKIRPKKGRRMVWPEGGAKVGAAEVDHPGTRPQPFMRRAFAETSHEVLQRIGDNLREEIARTAARAAARAAKLAAKG
ncbi:MAG: HK97-gp10 family putative phage morphogenesis protein [Pseudomonadota bacterium]